VGGLDLVEAWGSMVAGSDLVGGFAGEAEEDGAVGAVADAGEGEGAVEMGGDAGGCGDRPVRSRSWGEAEGGAHGTDGVELDGRDADLESSKRLGVHSTILVGRCQLTVLSCMCSGLGAGALVLGGWWMGISVWGLFVFGDVAVGGEEGAVEGGFRRRDRGGRGAMPMRGSSRPRDGREEVGEFGDEGLLLVDGELEDAAAFGLFGEGGEDAAFGAEVGVALDGSFRWLREGVKAKEREEGDVWVGGHRMLSVAAGGVTPPPLFCVKVFSRLELGGDFCFFA